MTEPGGPPEDPAAEQRPSGLTVGFVEGVTLTKWRRIWAERYPRHPLRVIEIAQTAVLSALDQAQLDMCFARLPLDHGRLQVIPLYAETPVVVARKDHPIAAYDEISLADLADEPTIDADHPDAFDLVAGGVGVLLVPQSIARSHSRRDLVHRPITDGTPTQVGLAWLSSNPNELIDDFIGVVRGRTVNSSRSRPKPRQPAKAPPPGSARPPKRRQRRRS